MMEDHTNDFTTLTSHSSNEQEIFFMFTQLIRDIFLVMEPDDQEQGEFKNFCQTEYANNNIVLKQLQEFSRFYQAEDAILWYTRPIFLFGLLNRVLRSQDMLMILHLRFFIRDLYRKLQSLQTSYSVDQSSSLNIVYRGQGMRRDDFEYRIKNNIGGLLLITTFWSTSRNTNVADIFVEIDPLKEAILFEITLDTRNSDSPFADISHLSAIPHEEEILISMGTVFRITDVNQNSTNGIWHVNLLLTSNNDTDLRRLTTHIDNEMEDMTPWYKLGHLMLHMGQFDIAMNIYEELLTGIAPEETIRLGDIYHQMALIHEEKDNFDLAFSLYSQSLELYKIVLPEDDSRLAHVYTGLGHMLQKQDRLDLSKEYFDRALEIDLCSSKPNYQIIAERHSNVGMAFMYQRKLNEGLAKFEQTLEIQLNYLPPNHADLAVTYNNISTVYAVQHDFIMALFYIEKALHVEQQCRPNNHPSIAAAHYSVTYILIALKRYHEAIEHTQKALTIARQIFSENHPRTNEYREQLIELLSLQSTTETN